MNYCMLSQQKSASNKIIIHKVDKFVTNYREVSDMSIMLVNGKFLISAIFLTFLTTTMETTTEIPNQDSSFGCINTELTPKGMF